MPRGDGTGPFGIGPVGGVCVGSGLRRCWGFGLRGYRNRNRFGYGFGRRQNHRVWKVEVIKNTLRGGR